MCPTVLRRRRARPRRRCRSDRRRRPRWMMTVPASRRSGTSRAATCSSDIPGSGAKIGVVVRRRRRPSSGGAAAASMAASGRARSDHEDGKQRADDDERRVEPQRVDEEGCDHRADSDRDQPEHRDDTEHPGEDVVCDGPLNERERRDVDERVPDAEKREQDEREHERLPDPEHDQRRAPEDDPDHECRTETLRTGEREREHSADDRPDSGGGVQVTDACVSEIERVDRDDDEKDLSRTRDERLSREESDENAQRRVVSDRTESRKGLRRNGRRLHLAAWGRLSRVDEEDEDASTRRRSRP